MLFDNTTISPRYSVGHRSGLRRGEASAFFHRSSFPPTTMPFVLDLNQAAKSVWVKFHDDIESKLAPGGDLPADGVGSLDNRISKEGIQGV